MPICTILGLRGQSVCVNIRAEGMGMTKIKQAASGRRKTGKKRSPQKGKAGGKLYPLSMRTTLEVRKLLEDAAAKNGRSMASEVEDRLLASFTREQREVQIAVEAASGVYISFGDPETFTLMRLLANAISLIEQRSSGTWDKDPETFDQVKKACVTVLEIFGPRQGEKQGLRGLAALGLISDETKHLGADIAKRVVGEWQERLALIDELTRPPAEATEET